MSAPTSKARLVPVVAATWAAAATAVVAPQTAPWLAIGGWMLALAALAALAWRRRPAHWHIVLVLLAAAAAAAASHVALATPARAASEHLALGGGRAIEVTATVTGKIEHRALGDLAFDAVATRITIGGDGEAVVMDVAIQVQPGDVEGLADLDAGSSVIARGTATPADPGDRAVVIVRATRGVSVVSPPGGPAAVAAALRHGLLAATKGLPQPAAGLIPGLAVGDTSAVDPSLDAAMKQSSLSHLTAVSGANCALVVGLAFGAAALAGLGRGARVVCGVAALGAFVLLVTPEPSVVRAGAMAAVAMLAVLLGRPAAGLAVLSLGISALMIADPWLSVSLGFALSAVATAALIVLSRPLAAGLVRWMPRALAIGLSVPVAAQLACGPLLVLIQPSIPLYGVVANLLAAPAAPIATIVGLAACIAAPLPWLQSGLTALTWLPASWIAGTATMFAALPGGQVPWLEGWPGAVALAALGAAISLAIAVTSDRRGWRMLRSGAVAVVAVVVGVLAGGAALSSIAAPLTVPHDWAILACDVGQGDAVLVRSEGRVALVDTGPDPEPLSACLTKAGVAQLDLLVLTHYDADHSGGLEAVIGRVGTVLHGPPVNEGDRAALARIAGGGAQLVPAKAGMHGMLGGAAWIIRWPVGESRGFPGGNDASVIAEFAGGGVPSSVFLGDLSATPQSALVSAGTITRGLDVVKVAHHGSADQDPELYRYLAPAVALISVGQGNHYGHPRAETLAVLDDLGARIVRTDLSGAIALRAVPDGVSVWLERGDGPDDFAADPADDPAGDVGAGR